MLVYLARRLAWTVAVLVAIGLITFLLTFVAPGDPARAIAGRNASAESVERIRHALGLDRSILEQLAGYFGRVAQGDFGHSYKKDADVLPYILARFPATLELAVAGILVAVSLGIPIGLQSARHPGGLVDRIGEPDHGEPRRGADLLGRLRDAVPVRVPARDPPRAGAVPDRPVPRLRPAIPGSCRPCTLGLGGAAFYARITRTAMLDELGLDYVRTARSKGIAGATGRRRRHALRNALPPILIQIGLDMGFFLGGVVVVEAVFELARDRQARRSTPSRAEDLPMLMGTVLFASLCVVLANLAVDLLIAVTDPRVQLRGRG